eukprot:8134404-Pyramimonas_sp.AAC.1
MDVDDLRATLDAAGIPAQPSDDAEVLRGKIRKMQTSYLSMCKRQKPSADVMVGSVSGMMVVSESAGPSPRMEGILGSSGDRCVLGSAGP